MGNATSKGKEEEYLKNILLNKGARAAEQDIRRIWTYFDCNKNTTLEVKEVKKMQRLRVSLFKDEAYKLCEMDDDFMEQIDKHATTLINHPEILWRKLDINKDGHVRWDEFKTLAADCILVSPFASIIESFKRKKGGYSEEEHRGGSLTDGNQSEAEEAHSPSLVIEDQGIIQNGVLGDEIDEIETVDDTVASLHPYGWEGVLFDVQDLKTKIVTIRFPFGLCYAHPKNVKIHLEKHHPDPPGMDAVEKLEPCSVEALQRPGLSGSLFYDKVAMDALGSNDISMLSEEEMELLLPWLLTLPGLKDIVRRRLKASRRLIRKGFWLRLADFQMLPHGPFFVTELNQTTGMTNSINFFCRRLVQECEENYVFQDEQLYCPIWPEWDVCTIKVKKKFSSGNAPSLLHCKLEGLTSFTHPLMFKPDDIRSDMCVMHSFGIFNQIWKQSKPLFKRFSARVFTFDCCPMAQSVGVMQFIQGAVTLDEWKASVIQDLPEEDQINFICSAAGSYVACYVLGCRDRHFDNFMVKDDSTFLQIDFKRCFDRKASGPVDAPHFSIKADVKMELCKLKFKVVKGVDQYGNPIIKYPNGWHIFKELCWHALKALRAKGVAVVKLVTGMFAGLRKRVRYFRNVEAMKRWVHFALNLGATDEEARLHLLGLIDSGVTSVAKKLKNILHGLNVYRNKQTGPKEERIFKSTPRNRRRISHAEGFSNATLDKGDNTEGKQFHHRGRTVSVYSDYHHHHHRRHSPSLGSRKLIQRPPIKEDANASNSSNGHHITSNGSSFKGTKGLRNRTPTIDLSHQGYDESRVLNVYQLIRQRHEDLGKLDLSFNAFGLSGTRLISTGLLSCLNLRELHLGGLFFGPEGLKCISAFVSGNGVLEVLDVHQSQICEGGNYSGLKALCVALESLGCGLRELDISDNKIKHKGLEMVRQAIEKNFVIQEIRYQDNQFMPTDIDNINIQKLLRRNQMEKVVILTIESVRRIKVGHREKLKAKIFFPGSPTVESPAIAVKKDEVIWNFTTSFSVHESTIRTSVRVEIWGSKKIGYFQIGPSDLQIKSKETEKLSTKAGSSSSLAQEQKSRSSSPAANDRRNALIQKTRKSSEIRTYTLRDGHLNKGTIVVHVHAGDFLGGGIIRAIGEYRNSTEPRSRQKPEENDVTEELRKVVKNGFVMFEEGSDPFADVLFADEEIGMMQAMIESARTYTALRIEYRVGCHVVEKKVEVPIPDFTKIFVGFGVPASTIDDEELDESSESLGVNPSLRNLAHAYSSPKVFVSAPSMSGYRRMDEEERKMKKRALVRTASSERESVVRHPRLTRQARTISLPTSKAPNEMLSTSLETSKKHFSSNETAASLLLVLGRNGKWGGFLFLRFNFFVGVNLFLHLQYKWIR